MTKQKSSAHKKRQGKHHKITKRYSSSYWPYIPIFLLIFSMFAFAFVRSPSSPANVLAFATEMSPDNLLTMTNQRRASSDRQPLQINSKLTEAAQRKAQDMAQRDYWSHTTPDGEQPWVFVDEVEYRYIKAGENLAYGFLTSEQTINGWMNSPSHRDNMLDNSFSEVGFGFANAIDYQDSDAETIVVAMYASPLDNASITQADEPDNNEPATAPTISMEVPANTSDVQAVTRLESIIGERFAWATFGLGILSGGAASGMLLSHGIRLRKFLQKGGDFIMHHPMLDVCLVSLLLLTAFLADKVGYII
jgi:uncharacterized protein YkwD